MSRFVCSQCYWLRNISNEIRSHLWTGEFQIICMFCEEIILISNKWYVKSMTVITSYGWVSLELGEYVNFNYFKFNFNGIGKNNINTNIEFYVFYSLLPWSN